MIPRAKAFLGMTKLFLEPRLYWTQKNYSQSKGFLIHEQIGFLEPSLSQIWTIDSQILEFLRHGKKYSQSLGFLGHKTIIFRAQAFLDMSKYDSQSLDFPRHGQLIPRAQNFFNMEKMFPRAQAFLGMKQLFLEPRFSQT